MEGKFLLATGSWRSGQAHSTGWSCGEYGGRGKRIISSGILSDFREWNQARSIRRTIIVSFSLFVNHSWSSNPLALANSLQAIFIRSFETLGRRKNSLSQVAGRTKPYTYSHSYLVRWCAKGRFPVPFLAHTLRMMGWSPIRASSSAQTSIFFPGFLILISSVKSWSFF